jgi:curved DNA-binding protein
MDYEHVFDTLRDYWPGGQEAPVCVVRLSLAEAYRGARRTIDWDGAPLTLTIPAGVHSGTRLYLPRHGHPTTHAAEFCTVLVDDAPPLKRCGNDLHLDFTIDAFTAIVGGEVQVPTLAGLALLRVPPGTGPGTTLRLPGGGMPLYGRPEEHGDLCVRLHVRVRPSATALERKLIDDSAWLRGWRLPDR